MAKITTTVDPMYDRVVSLYLKKVVDAEMTGLLAKAIRKMSKQLAEDIVNNLDFMLYLQDVAASDKKSMTLIARKK